MTKSRIKKSSFLRGAWARYKRNKPALIGLGIIAVVIFLAVFADILAPYEKMALAQHADLRFLGPSKEHLLGTDAFGRDSFARLIHGARLRWRDIELRNRLCCRSGYGAYWRLV